MTRSNVLCAVFAFVLGATTVLVAKTKITFDPVVSQHLVEQAQLFSGIDLDVIDPCLRKQLM
jgi:hypothetical protein